MGLDKIYHLVAGAVLGLFTFIFYFRATGNYIQSMVAALGVGFGIGFAKEAYDYQFGGDVEVLDLVLTVVGSFIGSGLWALDKLNEKKLG